MKYCALALILLFPVVLHAASPQVDVVSYRADLSFDIEQRSIAATVDIDPGQSAADLYRTIENDRAVMTQRLATLRHVYRLFAERTDGVGPMELPDNSSASSSGS